MIFTKSQTFQCVAVGFVLGFPLMMGSRMLLNLREICVEEVSIPGMTSMSTIHFVAVRRKSGIDSLDDSMAHLE